MGGRERDWLGEGGRDYSKKFSAQPRISLIDRIKRFKNAEKEENQGTAKRKDTRRLVPVPILIHILILTGEVEQVSRERMWRNISRESSQK